MRIVGTEGPKDSRDRLRIVGTEWPKDSRDRLRIVGVCPSGKPNYGLAEGACGTLDRGNAAPYFPSQLT